MGVMECSRKNCDNIMCDTHIREYGYICNECKYELENTKPTSVQNVYDFMNTDKPIYNRDNKPFSLEDIYD